MALLFVQLLIGKLKLHIVNNICVGEKGQVLTCVGNCLLLNKYLFLQKR